MASIFDVAAYILTKTGTATTMKLQKLCYYSQAWSLVWDDVPIFDEDFQAWANGPVCAELFAAHKGKFIVSIEDLKEGSIDKLKKTQKRTIDGVLEFYGEKDPQWLSELTHLEAPWKDARRGISPGERSGVVITKESMQEYYSGI